MKHIYILFDSAASAIAASEFCGCHSIDGRLAPVPSKLKAGCGLAWKIELDSETKEPYLETRIRELSLLFERKKVSYSKIIWLEMADIHHTPD